MASLHLKLPCLFPIHSQLTPQTISSSPSPSPSPSSIIHANTHCSLQHRNRTSPVFRLSYRFSPEEDDEEEESLSFDEAVQLFNERDYYKCHDYLEAQWMRADEPVRTLLHGILQCAVGFHHLFNQNHKGAMMELGEGVCKLRKMNFKAGPFLQFEHDISAALDFIYNTQIELAACAEDMCLAMDQSERSYQLLGGYAAGQSVYRLVTDPNQTVYIEFHPQTKNDTTDPLRVKLPTLAVTEEHLMAC